MKYNNITYGTFIDRPNRFVALVETESGMETVHVKNTGRCKELLIPGSKIALTAPDNKARKTKYDLVAVHKNGLGWVNIDSQAPNVAVREWLEAFPEMFDGITLLKPEYLYGGSRMDFYMEIGDRKILLEVKGCTLEIDGVGYFPDAPTQRGVKHLRELTKAATEGFECYVAFVISMPKVKKVLPNIDTQPEFGDALNEAKNKGVKVIHLPCDVTPDTIKVIDAHIYDDEIRSASSNEDKCS